MDGCFSACKAHEEEVRVIAPAPAPSFDADAQDTDEVPRSDKILEMPPVLTEEDSDLKDGIKMFALRQFHIHLMKKDQSARVGVDVDWGNGRSLKVRRVKMGIAQDHNAQHPDQKVESGDFFLVINGKWGNSMELLNELMNAPTLEILVEKSCPHWLGKPLPVQIAAKDIMPGSNIAPIAEAISTVVEVEKVDPVVTAASSTERSQCAGSFALATAASSLERSQCAGSFALGAMSSRSAEDVRPKAV